MAELRDMPVTAQMDLIDTHVHLNFKHYKTDLAKVLNRAFAAGIKEIVNVGIDVRTSEESIALSLGHREHQPRIYATVGLHPHNAAQYDDKVEYQLYELAGHESVKAIGEIGLDYYYNFASPQVQQEVFRRQLRLAKELKLPVVIHDRDAHSDMLTILKEESMGELSGVCHCFSGDVELALQCIELGFHISLGGPVTFKNGSLSKEVAKEIPIERLILETDSPYLTPHPYRGKRNEPLGIILVAEEIAGLRGIDPSELAKVTSMSARKLFNLEG